MPKYCALVTHFVSVELEQSPRNDDEHIHNQSVLVAQSQSTAQRPPQSKLENDKQWHHANHIHCTASCNREIVIITLFFWSTVSVLWKLAEREKRKPTNRLLSEKTSATSDHCHTSLDRAKLPPASTAPGPGPAILREGTRIQSLHSDNFLSGITTKLLFYCS